MLGDDFSFDSGKGDFMGRLGITNYHCIMKCATRLSKATVDLAMDNLHEDYNHQCIFIESLDNSDNCVQYWKQNNQVDCEEPIRNMVKQNFYVEGLKV